ncbi:MAG: ROK family protein [Gemmataceae bacterium]
MFLGIEIGGTKLQLGIGRGDGILQSLWRGRVEPERGAAGIRAQIESAVPLLLEQAGLERGALRGVGIGFGGPVDDATRTVIKSHQIEGWDGFPLAAWISDLLGLPAVLGNDADVAGLAEALFGAGKGLSPIFYVTVGTGIGGGLIIDGNIYRGVGRGAAEIGHLAVWHFTSHAARRGPLESLASGWGIVATAEELLAERRDLDCLLRHLHTEKGKLTAEDVANAARQFDPIARDALHIALEELAFGLCQVIALLCPRRIVIGGGVSLMGEDLFFAPLRDAVARHVFRPFADCYEIVPAALGEEVVVHGAVALAQKT